jgi:hypothetical protein
MAKSGKLAALTSGALALPGLAAGPAGADSPTLSPSANYAFSYYKEDNLGPGDFADTGTGSRERYKIFAHQFNVLTPINSRTDASFDLVLENMSGASPWWVIADPDPNKVGYLQVMSGATIEEQRVDGQISLNRYFDTGSIFVTGGVSSEKDYLSGNFGFGAVRNYNDKNTVFSLGLGFSWDTITPTNFADFERLPIYTKEGISLDFSVSQILYRNAVLQAGLAYKNSEGFLSDPYKKVSVQITETRPDSRPANRNQLTLYGRYRHHIPIANASVHLDGAFHWDDWDVKSLSLEFAWYQTLFEYFQLVPTFRYYSQSQASFYGPIFQFSDPVFKTSDYRLSPYGALSYGLKATASLDDWPLRDFGWLVSLGYQRYLTSGDYALQHVTLPNPGLVEYHLFSVQVGGRF